MNARTHSLHYVSNYERKQEWGQMTERRGTMVVEQVGTEDEFIHIVREVKWANGSNRTKVRYHNDHVVPILVEGRFHE